MRTTFTIPTEMKEKMREVDKDWPDYLRAAIEEKIKESKKRMAAESMDRIRSKTRHGKFDSVKSIRENREA